MDPTAQPSVAVVIPVLNEERHLEEAVDAALKQGESAEAGGLLSRMKSIFRR